MAEYLFGGKRADGKPSEHLFGEKRAYGKVSERSGTSPRACGEVSDLSETFARVRNAVYAALLTLPTVIGLVVEGVLGLLRAYAAVSISYFNIQYSKNSLHLQYK